MVNNHWVWYKVVNLLYLMKISLVLYIITNTKNKKAYVGCKQYYSMGKRKIKWEMYTIIKVS